MQTLKSVMPEHSTLVTVFFTGLGFRTEELAYLSLCLSVDQSFSTSVILFIILTLLGLGLFTFDSCQFICNS